MGMKRRTGWPLWRLDPWFAVCFPGMAVFLGCADDRIIPAAKIVSGRVTLS
jgi:hypothetical protein